MNRQPILLLGFTRYTDQGLLVKTNFIISNMTGNPLYPDADTRLTDVETTVGGLVSILGKKGQVLNYAALKKEKRNVLIAALKVLGAYVRDKYPGNVANWQTSGYDVQTFDSTTQVPAAPTNLKGKDGTLKGEVLLSFDKMKYAVYYEGRHWQVGDNPPADMTTTGTSCKKMLFQALKSLTEYNFQVRSRGTKGVSEWSQVLTYGVR